jgi:hypothetical protein
MVVKFKVGKISNSQKENIKMVHLPLRLAKVKRKTSFYFIQFVLMFAKLIGFLVTISKSNQLPNDLLKKSPFIMIEKALKFLGLNGK